MDSLKKMYIMRAMVVGGALSAFFSGCVMRTMKSALQNGELGGLPANQRIFDLDIVAVDPAQTPQCRPKTPAYIEFKVERPDAAPVVIEKLYQLRDTKKFSLNITTQTQPGYVEHALTTTALRTHVFCLHHNITWDFMIDGELKGEITVDSDGTPTLADYVNHEP